PLMLRCGLGLTCFLTIMTPSTRTRFLSAMTRRTRPCLPLSLPAITSTLSFRLILVPAINSLILDDLVAPEPDSGILWCKPDSQHRAKRSSLLDNLGRQRDDLEELLLAELAGDGAEDAGSDRLIDVVDDDSGVLVEANIGTVFAAIFFARADDHGLDDLTL